jgi:enamine deaminase RidA (YjgF/YER057c/UK114 family)
VDIEGRLRELGVELPEVPEPRWAYVPSVRSGRLVFVSGQIGMQGGRILHPGKVGDGVAVEQAREAARFCAIQALAVVKREIGDLGLINRVVKSTVYVASATGFADQPTVANGASDFLHEALGDGGLGARAAVGVAELPMGASVEAEFIFEIQD